MSLLASSNALTAPPQISVVIPCLNEEDAVGKVVDQAFEGIKRSGRTGEVIVVDNGSTDRSAEVAAAARRHGRRGAASRVRQRLPRGPRRGTGRVPRHGRRGRYVSAHTSSAEFVEAARSRRRPRDRDRASRGRSMATRCRCLNRFVGQPHPHRHAQPPLRRQGLGRALRHARASPRGAARARPALDRHGVRVRDGVQGVPPRPGGERPTD